MKNNAIVFDFSNLCQRCLHLTQVAAESENPSWDLMKFMIFDKMFEFVLEAGADLDGDCDVLLALDSHSGYWRRDIYPPYKADRAAKRSNSKIDYARAFQEFSELAGAIKEHLPWKVIEVHGCEADDIIYTVSKVYPGTVMIHSSDSDYIQLVDDRVRLFRANDGNWFRFPYRYKAGKGKTVDLSKEEFLEVAIMTGQSGKDNVYNILTDTDWSGLRKPGFGIVAALKLLDSDDIKAELEARGCFGNYLRNKKLIDMTELPEEEFAKISEALNSCDTANDVPGFLEYYSWPSMMSGQKREEVLFGIAGVCGLEGPSLLEEPEDETKSDEWEKFDDFGDFTLEA